MSLRRFLSSRGFTLVELLVVILILGIIIAVAAPSFLGQTEKAHDSAAKQYLTIAYKAAKASSTDRDGKFVTASFTASDLAAVIQDSEPGLTAAAGNCPADATPDQKHIVVDSTYTTISTGGDDLRICNDPEHTIWTLTVTDLGPPIFSSEVAGAPPGPTGPDYTTSDPLYAACAAAIGSLDSADFQNWMGAANDGKLGVFCASPADDPYGGGTAYGFSSLDDLPSNGGYANLGTSVDGVAVYGLASGKYYDSYEGLTIDSFSSVPTNAGDADAPSISGAAATVGQQLVGNAGTWADYPLTYDFTWLRCDSSGTTCNTTVQTTTGTGSVDDYYTVVAADVGSILRLKVTAHNIIGASAPETSDAFPSSGTIAFPPVPSGGVPSITGAAIEGVPVLGNAGSWSNSPTSYDYTWKRCDSGGVNCNTTVRTTTDSGATTDSYVPTASDVGNTLKLTVVAYNSGGPSSEATSDVFPAAGTIAAVLPYADTILADNPLVYWRMDETDPITILADASGNGNTGTIFSGGSGVTSSSENPLPSDPTNTSLAFNTYGAIGSSLIGAIGADTSFTIEIWRRASSNPNDYNGICAIGNVAGCNTSGSGGMSVTYNETTRRFTFRVGKSVGEAIVYTSSPTTFGNWYLIAMTSDGAGTVKCYINGAEVCSVSHAVIPVVEGGVNRFSFETDDTMNTDEAAFYPTPLSDSRILAHYYAR